MEHITKSFGATRALKDVSFTLRRGTIHALCGENGAGKSTLMKILSGVHRPDSGKILINGAEKHFSSPADSLKSGIAMLYQELELSENLTVYENIFLGAEKFSSPLWHTIDDRASHDETSRLIWNYGFDLDPDAIVAELSPGKCQLVELLKALRRHSRIIVMDEPTSSLSANESEELFRIIRQLKKSDVAIIYISHHLEEVKAIADEISILRDGEVVATAPAKDLEIADIVKLMVGREIRDFYPERSPNIGDELFCAKNIISSSGKVHDISFAVRRGEIVGMAGLVGAGRSEIADAIFGVDPVVSGELYLNGKPIKISTPADAVKHKIGFLTEDRKRSGLCLGLASAWNITLPSYRKLKMRLKIKLKKELALCRQIGEKLLLKWSSPSAPAESLSGGNQQKLLLGRWILSEADFLIVDEPARGVDVGAKREIYALLNELAGRGKAILAISSELPELFGICDRIIVVREGKITGIMPVKETTPEQVMQLASLGKKI